MTHANYDEFDDDHEGPDEDPDDFDDEDLGDECGRWRNGVLEFQCTKAGSEECDWECPIGLPSRAGLRRK